MITGIVKNTLHKALLDAAKAAKKDCNKVQILLSLDPNDNEDVHYSKIIEGEPVKRVAFLELLNIRIDMLGKEQMARPFISKSILKQAEDLKVKPEMVTILIYTTAEKASISDVNIHLINNSVPERALTFEEIFGDG